MYRSLSREQHDSENPLQAPLSSSVRRSDLLLNISRIFENIHTLSVRSKKQSYAQYFSRDILLRMEGIPRYHISKSYSFSMEAVFSHPCFHCDDSVYLITHCPVASGR